MARRRRGHLIEGVGQEQLALVVVAIDVFRCVVLDRGENCDLAVTSAQDVEILFQLLHGPAGPAADPLGLVFLLPAGIGQRHMGPAKDQAQIGAKFLDAVADLKNTGQLRRGYGDPDRVIFNRSDRMRDHVEMPDKSRTSTAWPPASSTAAIFRTPRLGNTRSSNRNSDGGMTRQTLR